MRKIRYFAVLALGALALAFASIATVQAQAPWRSADTLKTEIYFGLRQASGKVISEEDWGKFLSEAVAPRFPGGMTVIDATGRSANAARGGNPTKILVLVHPNVGDSQEKLSQIKEEFNRRFDNAGIFHTDSPIRIAPAK
ncbi:MAG: hypothetical protein K0S54_56 [Alphaproteobacteria bacterium]|nr:hypothetical protein [Alphaproteobacteria bacterium]